MASRDTGSCRCREQNYAYREELDKKMSGYQFRIAIACGFLKAINFRPQKGTELRVTECGFQNQNGRSSRSGMAKLTKLAEKLGYCRGHLLNRASTISFLA